MSGLKGKTVLFLGSSVTYGWGSDGYAFGEMLAEQDGIICIKEAVSGTTLVDNGPDSYIARMKSMPRPEHVDLFLCQLSTNDATRGLPLGDAGSADTFTIAGAINHIIAFARETYGCPVAFYTNPRYASPAYEAMVELLLQIAGEQNVYVLDLWNDAPFNAISEAQRAIWMKDPIHPTYEGYQSWWLPKFEAFLNQIL